MAEIFEATKFEEETYEFYLKEMEISYAADMLSYMYADNAVDVLNELSKEQVASYLILMDKESAQEIKDLLHYDEYTAGSIMTTEYVSIPETTSCRSAMTIFTEEAPNAETIYYLFVVNESHVLTGVVSLRDLIIADEDTVIKEIMNERVVSVISK